MKRRTVIVEQPGRIESALCTLLPAKRAEVLAWVQRGAVYLDGRRVQDAATRVGPGARLTVVLEEAGAAVTEVAAPLPPIEILYEDQDVLAVNKPPGVTAQPTPGRVGDSLLDMASSYLGRPAGLVHRLDKETSGITLFGLHSDATSALAVAFREGRVQKEYLAVVPSGIEPVGRIDLPLSKDPARPGRWRASRQANGLSAQTRFIRLSDDGTIAVVQLFPETGRTHQLRAHLTALGFPILGDRLYGGADSASRCLLHAWRITVDDLHVEAPIPADFPPFTSPAGSHR